MTYGTVKPARPRRARPKGDAKIQPISPPKGRPKGGGLIRALVPKPVRGAVREFARGVKTEVKAGVAARKPAGEIVMGLRDNVKGLRTAIRSRRPS